MTANYSEGLGEPSPDLVTQACRVTAQALVRYNEALAVDDREFRQCASAYFLCSVIRDSTLLADEILERSSLELEEAGASDELIAAYKNLLGRSMILREVLSLEYLPDEPIPGIASSPQGRTIDDPTAFLQGWVDRDQAERAA